MTTKKDPTTILVVEDEPVLRRLLIKKLEAENWTILAAENGKVGLDMALKHHPTLILLDVIMPVMNGVTMLKELRQDSWGKKAQVILLTNLSDAEGIEQAAAQGVFDYFVKSDWSLDELAKHVHEKLDQLKA